MNSTEFNNGSNTTFEEILREEKTKGKWRCEIHAWHLVDIDFLINSIAPRAASAKIVPPGNAGTLYVLAAADRALSSATRNPPGYFWSLLHKDDRKWASVGGASSRAYTTLVKYRGRQPAPAH